MNISDFLEQHRQDMTELLCRLAAIPSVQEAAEPGKPYGKGVDDVLTLALAEAKQLGLHTDHFERRAGLVDLQTGPSKLAILCHLDVVPADPVGWTSPPFAPRLQGNRVYGRGVSDNKGPAVAALYALHAVKALGIPLKYNPRLYLGGCEENGCDDLTRYLDSHTLPEFVFTPDACFPVGNAERGRIVVTGEIPWDSSKLTVRGGKGVNIIPDYAEARVPADFRPEAAPADVRWELDGTTLRVWGKSTHAAHPRQGINALTALVQMLSPLLPRLAKNFPHGVFDGSGLGLNGGLDISLTQLRLENGMLFFTADGRVDLDRCAAELADIIEKNLFCPAAFRVKEPHFVDPHAEIVTRLNKVYEEITGRPGGTYTLDAMTYAHEVDNAVIFGGVLPGDGCGGAHAVDECYDLDTLVESAKLFAAAILEFCKE